MPSERDDQREESLQLLRSRALDACGDAMLIESMSGEIVDCNRTACAILGRPAEDLTSRPMSDLLPHDEVGRHERFLRVCTREGKIQDEEICFLTSSRQRVPMRVSLRLISGDGGSPVGIIWSGQEISRLRSIESAMNNDVARFRMASRAIQGIVYELDGANRQILHLFGALRLLGEEPTQVPCPITWWTDRVHPQDYEKMMRAVHHERDENGCYSVTYRVRRSDGVWLTVRDGGCSGAGVQVGGQRFIGLVVDVSGIATAEERAREVAERLMAANEAGNVGTWRVDYRNNRVIRDANQNRILGGPAEETVEETTKRYFDQIHPDDRQRALVIWEQSKQTRQPWDMEIRVTMPDDSVRWIRDRGRMIFDEQGLSGATGALADITERKETEIALRKALERQELVLEAAGMGMWSMQLDSRMARWDERCQRFFGLLGRDELPAEEIVGRISEEDQEQVLRAMQDVLSPDGTHTFDIEYRVETNGDLTWLRSVGRVLSFPDLPGAEPETLFGLTMDMTERHRMEQALREGEEQLRLATQAASIGIWRIREGCQHEWSSEARAIYGWSQEDVITCEQLVEIVLPQDRALVRRRMVEAAETRDGYIDSLYRIRRPDGVVRWVHAMGEVLEWEQTPVGRHPRVATGTIQDVTEMVAAQEALKETTAQLQEADRRKNEFLAVLGHELRNPLAALQNGVRLMTDGRLTPERHAWTHAMMGKQVMQLARLVDDLLDLTRITRGTIELRKEDVAVAQTLARAVESVTPLLSAKRHEFHWNVQPSDLHVNADPTRLEQMAVNLLNNAAKYTPPGGCIRLSASREDGGIAMRVQDSGIGLQSADLERIFEPFGQVGRGEGLGIGLTLTRQLAELHGGRVEACSEGPGKGSEFVIHLPGGHVGPAQAQMPSLEIDACLEMRVLIVDDNVDAAESLAILLRNRGCDTRAVHSGREALQVVPEFHPDLILLDIGLPDMDGHQVARELRRDYPLGTVSIVALTGYGGKVAVERTREAGFDLHLVKPVDVQDLISIIGRVARRRG